VLPSVFAATAPTFEFNEVGDAAESYRSPRGHPNRSAVRVRHLRSMRSSCSIV
jgi:hypothetical protein